MYLFMKDVGRSIEVVIFLVLGFYLTVNVAADFYGRYGIEFIGNIWVNGFGISYFLFAVYTAVMGLFIFKDVTFYNRFIKSKIYWLLFAGSIYIMLIPFVAGENPF